MKRFMLFAGEHYYAKGGAHDLVGSFDTLDDAVAATATMKTELWGDKVIIAENPDDIWWHVYDAELGQIVAGSKDGAY